MAARRAHNPKVGGSNPPPATKTSHLRSPLSGGFLVSPDNLANRFCGPPRYIALWAAGTIPDYSFQPVCESPSVGPNRTPGTAESAVRKLVALSTSRSTALLADEGTKTWRFCSSCSTSRAAPIRARNARLSGGAHAHLMGWVAYERMSGALSANADHRWADVINAGKKVVFCGVCNPPLAPIPPSSAATRRRQSTGSDRVASVTSWSGVASRSGGRSWAGSDRRVPYAPPSLHHE